METTASRYWIADLKTMTCKNVINEIVIGFKKLERDIIGKITYIPLVLLKEWGATPDGEKFIKNAVIEAEKVFLKAYFESKLERKTVRKRSYLTDRRCKEPLAYASPPACHNGNS